MEPIEGSSNIQAVEYVPAGDILRVQFQGGRIYRAVGVPAEEHAAFMASSSKGSYFAKHLKTRYDFTPECEPAD